MTRQDVQNYRDVVKAVLTSQAKIEVRPDIFTDLCNSKVKWLDCVLEVMRTKELDESRNE